MKYIAGKSERSYDSLRAAAALTLSALDIDCRYRCDSGLGLVARLTESSGIGASNSCAPFEVEDCEELLGYGRRGRATLRLDSASSISVRARLHSGQVVET